MPIYMYIPAGGSRDPGFDLLDELLPDLFNSHLSQLLLHLGRGVSCSAEIPVLDS